MSQAAPASSAALPSIALFHQTSISGRFGSPRWQDRPTWVLASRRKLAETSFTSVPIEMLSATTVTLHQGAMIQCIGKIARSGSSKTTSCSWCSSSSQWNSECAAMATNVGWMFRPPKMTNSDSWPTLAVNRVLVWRSFSNDTWEMFERIVEFEIVRIMWLVSQGTSEEVSFTTKIQPPYRVLQKLIK